MNQLTKQLLLYGDSLDLSQTETSSNLFCVNDEDNKLCIEDPFAFLLACQAAQASRANTIWRFPGELRRRLGHLDIQQIISLGSELANVLRVKPALHRFPATMAEYTIILAKHVQNYYNNNAANIWLYEPNAIVVAKRLREIKGFGDKKVMMTIQLLRDFLGVQLSDMHKMTVAPDIHVRRVLYRSGEAETMLPSETMLTARRMFPQDPGKLDYPLWKIGKKFCKSKNPLCNECPINKQCKKIIQ